jgi:hypothetical protein
MNCSTCKREIISQGNFFDHYSDWTISELESLSLTNEILEDSSSDSSDPNEYSVIDR